MINYSVPITHHTSTILMILSVVEEKLYSHLTPNPILLYIFFYVSHFFYEECK
jgi:hypothetical protein